MFREHLTYRNFRAISTPINEVRVPFWIANFTCVVITRNCASSTKCRKFIKASFSASVQFTGCFASAMQSDCIYSGSRNSSGNGYQYQTESNKFSTWCRLNIRTYFLEFLSSVRRISQQNRKEVFVSSQHIYRCHNKIEKNTSYKGYLMPH